MDNFKERIELAALYGTPGILYENTKFDIYIGHNVMNISQVSLTEHQVTALEKGFTFCPTPGAPDKSQIWDDFKEFHRRLELMQFFNPNQSNTKLNISQSIIDFTNEYTGVTTTDFHTLADPHRDIQELLRSKSCWKPTL